ncbi:transposase [Cyanobacteria bacterium FACHB-472]|nr:transposase [Cyanobacteria bacterium FACHB-472]
MIKEKLGTSGRETVEQIKETPYLQHFISQTHYSNNMLFDASLLVRFRERTEVNLLNRITERMVEKSQEKTDEKAKKKCQTRKVRNRRTSPLREINPECNLCASGHQLSPGFKIVKSS